MHEQTLSIIKPDAVERNLEDKIKDFFTENNLKILKSKKVKISREEASEFYKIHQNLWQTTPRRSPSPVESLLCRGLSQIGATGLRSPDFPSDPDPSLRLHRLHELRPEHRLGASF